MTSPQKLGATLAVIGALLLGTWLIPTGYGIAMSHLEVARFRSESSANRLWDSARIRAYRHTLSVSFVPPEAILRIPRASIEVPILEGTSEFALNRGVGHIPGTALPGQPGNLAIAGHRDGFFRGLKDVTLGDLIDIERPNHQIDHYAIRNLSIVSPSDTFVLSQTSASTLTLVTCYPFYFVGAAPQRYIVQADLIPPTQTASTSSTYPTHD